MNSLKVTKGLFVAMLFVISLLMLSTSVAAQEGYLKFNIHTQADRANVLKGSYANYTNPGDGHLILPAGTKINVTKKSRRGFYFTHDISSQEAYVEFHEPRMEMSVDEYIDLITTSSPVDLSKFSATDQQGIREGKAIVGMTREGVMTALGYPAAHRTPDLDANRWIYWQNRFRTLAVDFGADDKVSSITN